MPLLREISGALQDAERDNAIGVVVITGSGDRFFCPGLDLGWAKDGFSRPQVVWSMMNLYSRMFFEVKKVGKPVGARVNGVAAGGGGISLGTTH